ASLLPRALGRAGFPCGKDVIGMGCRLQGICKNCPGIGHVWLVQKNHCERSASVTGAAYRGEGGRVQIRVREMSARCRCCGGIEFAPVKRGAIGLADWFYCVECLAQRVHADLMVQIGEEAMKRTNAFIAVHKAIADEVKSARADLDCRNGKSASRPLSPGNARPGYPGRKAAHRAGLLSADSQRPSLRMQPEDQPLAGHGGDGD